MKKLIGLFITAAVFLVAAVFIFKSDKVARTLSEASYRWSESSKVYSYQLLIKSDIALNGVKIQNNISIDTLINFKIFDVSNGEVRAALAAENLLVLNEGKPDQKLMDIYSLPLLVVIDEQGKFKEVIYPANATEHQRKSLLGFYSYLESVIANKKDYTVFQSDSIGKFEARYLSNSEYIEKFNNGYVEVNQAENYFFTAQPSVVYSNFSFTPDESGIWLKELKGKERVEYLTDSGDTPLAGEVELYLKPSNEKSNATIFNNTSFEQAKAKLAKGLSAKERTVKRISKKAVQESDDFVNGFVDILNSMPVKPSSDDYIRLMGILEVNNEYIAEVPGLILSGGLNEMHKQVLISLLGKIGSDEAQLALLELVSDSVYERKDRMSAVFSASSIARPLATELDAYLFDTLDNLTVSAEILDIGSTSVLAIGSIAENMSKDYPLESKELSSRLASRLAYADSYQKKYILLSLGNTHDASYADVIADYLASNESELRLTAAESLSYIDRDIVEEKLAESYISENDDNVKLAIIKSLKNRENMSDSTIVAVTDSAELESSLDVRREVIGIISDKIIDHPELKDTLDSMLATEQSKENVKRIIKAIGKLRMHNKYGTK